MPSSLVPERANQLKNDAAKRLRSNRGMSLVESLVAGAVLLIGLFGIAGLQVVAIATNFEGRTIAQASAIATSFASNISRWDYTDSR